jgi:hypothetical protein
VRNTRIQRVDGGVVAAARALAQRSRTEALIAARTAIDHTGANICRLRRPGTTRSVAVNTSGSIRVAGRLDDNGIRLPVHVRPTWARDVAAAGLAVVDGSLVLDLIDSGNPPLRALYLDWKTDPLHCANAIAFAQHAIVLRGDQRFHLGSWPSRRGAERRTRRMTALNQR